MEKNMKEWKIPVCWEMVALVTVQAATLEEALQYVQKDLDNMSLPTDAEYTGGRFGPSMCEIEAIREVFNNGQKDFSY